MKRLLTLAVVLLITLTSFCQKTYTAIRTEIYEWRNNEWTLYKENRNVEIPIHVLKQFIHIEAKDNAYFLLSEEPTVIKEKTFKGFTYQAYEFTIQKKCSIDVVDFTNGITMVIITWFDDGMNIRY
jgi:hypothetical protein